MTGQIIFFMDSLIFFGSLRSKALLKTVIGSNLNHLKFFNGKIHNAKLYKVKNENFPYLEKTNSYDDVVSCIYIQGLSKENFDKILFYESIEYKISKITISINKEVIKTHFFELIKKNKTSEIWCYSKWKDSFEDFSCIAAKEWMVLFEEYKNNPKEAEIYWQEILANARVEINK